MPHSAAKRTETRDGRLPIDNNQVKRLMKRIEIGRKNWVVIGSVRGDPKCELDEFGGQCAASGDRRWDVHVERADALSAGYGTAGGASAGVWKANHLESFRTYRELERRDKTDGAHLSAAKRRAFRQLKKLL